MSSYYGEKIRLTIFGQSHSAAIGMTLEGLPAGEEIDIDELRAFLARRAPGKAPYATSRAEADLPEFLSGLCGGVTCGAPLTAIIRNTDVRPGDYEDLRYIPRPGHADYTAYVKYGGHQDASGGGHFSGRMTAPLCIAGGILTQLLRRRGISVFARIFSVGDILDEGVFDSPVSGKDFPVVSDEKGAEMRDLIARAKACGDSVGGVVECVVTGVPAGMGGPMFEGMESRISAVVFGIPAVKGVEFGAGFGASVLRGSENNDPYEVKNGRIVTRTNNAGGILGGITNGMPVVFRAAFKPTPSISKPQHSVDLRTMKPAVLNVGGRHDPCIVPRAVPAVEAAAALAVYDAVAASSAK